MISFIIGLFVGDFIGVALMALMYMVKDSEPKQKAPECKESTTLWSVGDICKFEGDVYEIKSFMEINGHTYVRLSHYDTGSSLSVPVEELEAMEE